MPLCQETCYLFLCIITIIINIVIMITMIIIKIVIMKTMITIMIRLMNRLTHFVGALSLHLSTHIFPIHKSKAAGRGHAGPGLRFSLLGDILTLTQLTVGRSLARHVVTAGSAKEL